MWSLNDWPNSKSSFGSFTFGDVVGVTVSFDEQSSLSNDSLLNERCDVAAAATRVIDDGARAVAAAAARPAARGTMVETRRANMIGWQQR
jgi:hypothetical protein